MKVRSRDIEILRPPDPLAALRWTAPAPQSPKKAGFSSGGRVRQREDQAELCERTTYRKKKDYLETPAFSPCVGSATLASNQEII